MLTISMRPATSWPPRWLRHCRRARAALVFAVLACASLSYAASAAPEYGYRVVHVYPHDPAAFTQGLEYRGGFLYEGTGLLGQSVLRKVKLETGEVLQQIRLDPQLFGEGITVINQHIVQFTWQSQIGFVYDQASFQRLRSFSYPGEGWGLANDGNQIYMSDGTSQIRVWDTVTLHETKRITVHDGSQPVVFLNELECVRGEIYANVWQTDRIARISPADGRVLGWIDASGLLTGDERSRGADVLNGIAYDSLGDRLFVTGKQWPKLFEIKLFEIKQVPKAASSSKARKSAKTSGTSGNNAFPAARP